MEILKLLQESGNDLYPEDLDFFEAELDTGEYEREYIDCCKTKIRELRSWLKGGKEESSDNETGEGKSKEIDKNVPKGIVVDMQKVAPAEANPTALGLTPEKITFMEIARIREGTSSKSKFKKYVEEHDIIDADFVDKNYAFFEQWELDAIVSVKQMPEEFLEKYFGALDHDKIARYQKFSESFFMKHFSQMDAEIVLAHGKNDWKKKEKRSKQLDVFLRLKGVKI